MTWFIFSLIATICTAGVRLINQYSKVSGFDLTVANKSILVVLSLPFIFAYGLPEDPLFYCFVLATVPLCLYQDARIFDIAAKYGGGVLTRVTPLHVPIVFVFWMMLSPALFLEYLQTPAVFAVMLACISGCVFFSVRMQNCEVNAAALRDIFPVLFLTAATIILNKLAMDYSPLHAGVYAYIFVQAVCMSGVGLGWIVLKQKRALKSLYAPALMKASLFVAFAILLHLITKNYAFSLVEDPTLPSVILLTAPFFILVFYKLTGHKEKADIWPGIGVVLCVLLLTAVTTL